MPTTYTRILLHIVFSTKSRRPFITPELRDRLYPFIGGIVRDEGSVLYAIGGEPDHLHLLVRWRADATIADLLRNIKSRSSKWIHETFPDHREFAWQEGYGAFSVSESQAGTVKRYIENQEKHHQKRSFPDEFLELLRAHSIEFDNRYVFD